MMNRSKLIALCLTALLTLSLLTGCGAKKTDTQTAQTQTASEQTKTNN